jgi:hypothetical protein
MTTLNYVGVLSGIAAALCTPLIAQRPVQATLQQTVQKAVLQETLAPSVNGNTVQLAAGLSGRILAAPGGTVSFVLVDSTGATHASGPVPLSTEAASWTVQAATGPFTSTASYSGDSNYMPATATAAASAASSAPPDFDFATQTITIKRGDTWSGTVPVQSLNGFTGMVNFAWGGTPPHEMTLSMPTAQVNVAPALTSSSAPQVVSLKIVTVATTVTAAGLPFLFLLGFAGRRRKQRLLLPAFGAASLVLLAGCGAGQKYIQDDGTPVGTYQLTLTGSSGSITHVKPLTVIVTQ